MHEIAWNALQDTNSQSGVTCPFFLLRGAQSSSPYVLDSGRSATWDSYKTDNLATNVTNLHFSAGGSIVQICCANVFFERIQEPKEERKEKEAGSTDLVFSETILFLAWTGSGVATVRQLRLNEHWISRTQWEKTDSRHSWTTVTAVTGSARQDCFDTFGWMKVASGFWCSMAESDGISVQDEWWWLAHRSHGNKASILDILRVAAFSMSKMPCCSRFSVVLRCS